MHFRHEKIHTSLYFLKRTQPISNLGILHQLLFRGVS
jgi:hypothetical protein